MAPLPSHLFLHYITPLYNPVLLSYLVKSKVLEKRDYSIDTEMK